VMKRIGIYVLLSSTGMILLLLGLFPFHVIMTSFPIQKPLFLLKSQTKRGCLTKNLLFLMRQPPFRA
jgi:hypothetical protein